MNKKTRTILFLLGGTAFNIITTIICFLILMVIFSRFAHNASETAVMWVLPVSFILAIAASFVIYRQVLKIIMKKVDIESHFDPLFGNRHPKPPQKP